MTQWTRRAGILASGMAVALTLSACSGAPARAPSVPGQSNAAPAAAPALPPPYRFGEVQQKAPPITDGQVPLLRRIQTDKPYVFITMDDGAIKDPDALRLIQQSGTRPVLFLNQRYVRGSEEYFRSIVNATGAVIADHTVDHQDLKGKPYEFQRAEICDDADYFQREFGKRPELFRPPFGSHDQNTLRAAADCGMRAALLWTVTVNNGQLQYQIGDKLRPGDIVLMHFRQTFVQDFTAFLNAARRDGLTPVPLTDFLG
jgi:peptidoglycan/xylan/chitin deacetylase (PgdA/CDA1 family)